MMTIEYSECKVKHILSSKQIILLGDSHFCGIAYNLMGFKYTKVTKIMEQDQI